MTAEAAAATGRSAGPATDTTDPTRLLDPATLRQDVAARFTALVESGALVAPLPGSGRTGERFRALSDLGRADLSLARLGEGHLDAVAILHELDGPRPGPGERWGVWAAQPPGPGLSAERR
ncbi:hypothetical protein HY68_28435, partial [Streptomyces sp. AcH 505]